MARLTYIHSLVYTQPFIKFLFPIQDGVEWCNNQKSFHIDVLILVACVNKGYNLKKQ